MPFRVSGKNIDIGEALRARINQRVAEATAKYFDGGFSGHVTIGKEGFGFRTECVIHLDSGIMLEAEALAADAYASADQAALRIEKRLRRYKRRLKDHQATRADGHAPGELGAAIDAPSYVIAAPEHDTDEEVDRVEPGHHRRIDHGAEAAVGQRGGDGTRHDRRRRRGVPSRWTRPHQSGLSPRGRPYRLDRSADDRARTPIDGAGARSLWSAAFGDVIPAELPDCWNEFHAAHRSRRAQCDHSGAQGQRQEAGAAGARRQGGGALRPERAHDLRDPAAAREARLDRRRQWHRHTARQAAEARQAVRACLRGSSGRSISRRSTASRSISCFCCWRRKAPAPIISRRWRAWRGCCAIPTSRASCASSRDAEALYAVLAMPSASAA